MDAKLIVLRLVPAFDDEFILNTLKTVPNQIPNTSGWDPVTAETGLKAIVLELYGVGNVPSKKENLFKAIQLGLPPQLSSSHLILLILDS